MNNNYWSKKLTALLLVIGLLSCCLAGSLAEGTDAAVVADLTAEEEPVLLASVNGDEIWSNNEEMQALIDYYLSYYSAYGYDTTDEGMLAQLKAAGLHWAIEGALYHQKAAELGVADLTDDQKAELEAAAKAEWEQAVSYYAQSMGGLTEESTEEEKTAARVDALAYIESELGYTEESYISEYVEGSRETQLRENVRKAVLGEFSVTDDEVMTYFNELVEEDKATYEGNVPMYEFYTHYQGSNSYYIPEGYRGITHILLNVDKELMDNYTSLVARMEEQEEEETADGTAENTAGTEAEANAEAEATAEADATAAPEATEEPKEPVTQEMIDAARQAIMDSVQAQVDEIMAKYASGTPFVDLIDEYGTDPGMKQEPTRTEGYAVHADSILWDKAFTEGAMALKEIGDVSEPVLGSHGVHLLHYTRDIPGGAVEVTEEIRKQLEEELLSEKETAAVTEMVEGWMNEAEIVYTEEGQAILDAAEKADAETVETTEATEETLKEDQ